MALTARDSQLGLPQRQRLRDRALHMISMNYLRMFTRALLIDVGREALHTSNAQVNLKVSRLRDSQPGLPHRAARLRGSLATL